MVLHKHPAVNQIVVSDGECETRDGFHFGVALFLDDVKDVDPCETYDVCGHLAGCAVGDFTADGFTVKEFIVIGSNFFSGFADFICKGAPEGVVVFAKKRQKGIGILPAYAVDPLFDGFPCRFSSGCMFYVHASLREMT